MMTTEARSAILLSTAYLPPVSYCSAIRRSGKTIFEKHEHYIKQSYRNRALIAGTEKILPLVIPVRHERLYDRPIHEVRISYEAPWQRNHWRAIESLYRNSPYFEFLEDDFREAYRNPVETLFEWNLSLLHKVFGFLKLPFAPGYTDDYKKAPAGDTTDLRNSFHPADRKPDLPVYSQVFGERHGFLSDLSILDLLFVKGPGAPEYFEK